MSIGHLGALAFVALILSSALSYAGPCSIQVDEMQARVDALIAATAANGPAEAESVAATAHHQPTPGSIAAAEEKLGEGARAERALAAMAQARTADEAGDSSACQQALASVKRVLDR